MEENLDIISQTIDLIENLHEQFCRNFYDQPCLQSHHLKSLKKFYVRDAQNDDYFMNEFLPQYYQALDELDCDTYLLENFAKFPTNSYRYRIKSNDTVIKKLAQYACREQEIGSINLSKCLNDIFGVRLILDNINQQIPEINELLSSKKASNKLKWYYYRDKDGYRSFQCYFQRDNKVLPWKLQIWDSQDKENNIKAHLEHERERNMI